MLSYRHAFHAGNFADLLKHLIQVEVLHYMLKKDKPFDYIDTHAGAGLYKLSAKMANKNAEFNSGIGHFFPGENTLPELQNYLDCIGSFNKSKLEFYPGSPVIAAQFLRKYDKAWLCELHPKDHDLLAQRFNSQRNIRVRQEDGFQALQALLPCQSRRALVLIDPPFELKEDYQRIPKSVIEAYKKMPNTVFCIWYPVVDRRKINDLQRRFKHSGIRNISCYELGIEADQPGHGMTSSGMIVINPPWTLSATLTKALPHLAKVISKDGQLHYRMEQLVEE